MPATYRQPTPLRQYSNRKQCLKSQNGPRQPPYLRQTRQRTPRPPPHHHTTSISTTMASPHTLNTVTIGGDYVPASGLLIKLRLGKTLDGSLASLTSDSRSIRSTSSSPTHSALVLSVRYILTRHLAMRWNRVWGSPASHHPHLCVIFYFISRYMRPEGPWQRRSRCPRATAVGFLNMTKILSQTDITGHSKTPHFPDLRQEKI